VQRSTKKEAAIALMLGDNGAMFHIVLVHPEIPPNTGNVIRLAANTGSRLHLVAPLGFQMDDKQLRRAGLDYHETASVKVHANWEEFMHACRPAPDRIFAMTTKGQCRVHDTTFKPGDYFVFGSETRGLPTDLRDSFANEQRLILPMLADQRSLNLSNSVAVVVYEAWRQNSWAGAAPLTAAPD
jgi:tRNA (cytidine/uridine-2'-O-)-methyltransferase